MAPVTLDPQVFGRAFAEAVAIASGQKESGVPSANLMYGAPVPGAGAGYFGVCGLDNTLINAAVSPRGIERILRAYGTDITNPQFPIFTGIEQLSGQTEPSTSCGDCIIGESEGCILTVQFGRFCRGTKELSLPEINTRATPGEFRLQLFGDITDAQGNPVPGFTNGTVITDERTIATVEAAVLLQRLMLQMIWQGNPVNNLGAGYWEFPGFDLQIGTGKIDANTGVTCPAADSDVKSFGYAAVDSTASPDLVTVLSMMEAYLYHKADRVGLSPVEWVLAMRPELWHELTEIWPCRYHTTRCSVGGGATNGGTIDMAEMIQIRDSMRNGMYLMLNGRRYPVITDDGIYEHNNANDANLQPGEFASDIYFVPLRARGREVTYLEYLDFSRTLQGIDTGPQNDSAVIWSTDGGRFLVSRTYTNWCYHINVLTKPRLVLRTPHLAGRVTHVKYSPLQHFASPIDTLIADGSRDPYFSKGGVSSRTTTQQYSEWNARQ